jgi:thiamine-monophosphate kinase
VRLVHADAALMSRADGRAALDHALNDGEDFELCFTAPPAQLCPSQQP